jgi:hypothetical protein
LGGSGIGIEGMHGPFGGGELDGLFGRFGDIPARRFAVFSLDVEVASSRGAAVFFLATLNAVWHLGQRILSPLSGIR